MQGLQASSLTKLARRLRCATRAACGQCDAHCAASEARTAQGAVRGASSRHWVAPAVAARHLMLQLTGCPSTWTAYLGEPPGCMGPADRSAQSYRSRVAGWTGLVGHGQGPWGCSRVWGSAVTQLAPRSRQPNDHGSCAHSTQEDGFAITLRAHEFDNGIRTGGMHASASVHALQAWCEHR